MCCRCQVVTATFNFNFMKESKSVLDEYVSCFKNYNCTKPSQIVGVLDWLATDVFKTEVLAIRKERSKVIRNKLKANLPAITISGVFEPTRKSVNLQLHSGLLAVDIDYLDNPSLKKIDVVKKAISKMQEIAYCGLSVSGKGLFAIVKIETTENHRKYFDALELLFYSEYGIKIDKSCKNVDRLRGASYDPDAYFNHNAATFTTILTAPKKRSYRHAKISTDNTVVNRILMAVLKQKTDITTTHDNWFKICCVLVNEFGEDGRNLFHAFSQFHLNYDRRKCDYLYDDLLSRDPYNYSLGTLCHIAKQHGIIK